MIYSRITVTPDVENKFGRRSGYVFRDSCRRLVVGESRTLIKVRMYYREIDAHVHSSVGIYCLGGEPVNAMDTESSEISGCG
jgi:hypothetical protein